MFLLEIPENQRIAMMSETGMSVDLGLEKLQRRPGDAGGELRSVAPDSVRWGELFTAG